METLQVEQTELLCDGSLISSRLLVNRSSADGQEALGKACCTAAGAELGGSCNWGTGRLSCQAG